VLSGDAIMRYINIDYVLTITQVKIHYSINLITSKNVYSVVYYPIAVLNSYLIGIYNIYINSYLIFIVLNLICVETMK